MNWQGVVPNQHTEADHVPSHVNKGLVLNTKHCATVGVLNARKLDNKTAAINDCIRSNRFDIFAITETWHDDANSPCLINSTPSGYKYVEKARPRDAKASTSMDTNYGGICIFIRSRFRASIVNLPEYKTAEILVVSISSSEFKAILFVIYRPGSAAITSLFFEELADAFERCSGYENLIVVGDVNVHLDCPALSTTKQFVSLLGVYDLLECVQQPTHNRGHQLDVYITRSDQLQPVIRVDPPIISDHSLITATYNIELNTGNNRPRVPRRRWSTFNVDDFTSDLIASDLICNPPDGVSELFACYDETLTQLLDKHAPVIYVTQYARPSSPWFNTECHLAKVRTRKL